MSTVLGRIKWNIQSVVAAAPAGITFAGSTQLVRSSEWDVFLVTNQSGGVILPTTSEIGDIVEIHETFSGTPGGQVTIFSPMGETINQTMVSGQNYGQGNASQSGQRNTCSMLRKVSATDWEPMSFFTYLGP